MEVCTLIRIDDRIKRVDAVAKARGEAQYLSDLRRDGMLYARMVRSTIPRGVMIAGDWRCFADGDVRYVGETIGLLVGKSRAVLKALDDAIKITYEEEEPCISIDDSIALKGGAILGDDNVHCSLVSEKGEPVDDVLERADRIIEETIETGFQEHVHMETNAAMCTIEDGKYTIYASAQCPFYIRKSICRPSSRG